MEAQVVEEFVGCADGESKPRTFKVGEIISGDLARVALDEKWAKRARRKKPRAATAAQSKPSNDDAAEDEDSDQGEDGDGDRD